MYDILKYIKSAHFILNVFFLFITIIILKIISSDIYDLAEDSAYILQDYSNIYSNKKQPIRVIKDNDNVETYIDGTVDIDINNDIVSIYNSTDLPYVFSVSEIEKYIPMIYIHNNKLTKIPSNTKI